MMFTFHDPLRDKKKRDESAGEGLGRTDLPHLEESWVTPVVSQVDWSIAEMARMSNDVTSYKNLNLRGPIGWDHLSKTVQSMFFEFYESRNCGYWFDVEMRPIDPKTNNGRPEWTDELVEPLIENGADLSFEDFSPYGPGSVKQHRMALSAYPIRNKRVAVIGSTWPWVESTLYAFHPSSITTVDFNPPMYDSELDTPRFEIMDVARFHETDASNTFVHTFDAIFSYSSIEHDGWGGYQDLLNPYGDFRAMQEIKAHLKPGGLLYLGVPVVKEEIMVYNYGRMYGPCRLNALFADADWELLQIIDKLGNLYSKTDELFEVVNGLGARIDSPLFILSSG